MTRPPTGSEPIDWLSPTSLERLRTCLLQAAFARSAVHPAPSGPAARLGTMIHAVLEAMVRSDAIRSDDWQPRLDDAWRVAVDEARRSAATLGVVPADPERWPDYSLKRAQIRRTAERFRTLLRALPADATLLPEEELTGLDGRLRGRADLVIRGSEGVIVDYKSGAVLDEAGVIRASYERQLLTYAFLEHETTGRWPDRLVLMPMTGPVVEIPVRPATSLSLAAEARALLDRYAAAVPGPQPATVSLAGCSRCASAVGCPAFWSAYDATWKPWVIAARGPIGWLQRSNGRVTLTIDGPDTRPGDRLTIRGVDLDEHPTLAAAQPGDRIAVVGLHEEADRGTYRLWPSARLDVSSTLPG